MDKEKDNEPSAALPESDFSEQALAAIDCSLAEKTAEEKCIAYRKLLLRYIQTLYEIQVNHDHDRAILRRAFKPSPGAP